MGTVYNPLHRSYPLFFLGLGVIIAYVPGIIGASISTGWLFLFITVPILFIYCDFKIRLGFFFICYAAISLFWTEVLNIAWFYLLQLIVLSLVFVIGQNIKDLKAIFKGLAVGLGISAFVAIAQTFGYRGIFTLNNTTAGLFINPNIYSEASAIILVSLVVLKLWWWIPVTLPGLLLVQSRAAYVGLGVGLLFAIWKYNKYYALVLVILSFLLALVLYKGQFNFISVQERLDMWVDTLRGISFFGGGVGSYEALYPYYAIHIDTELQRPRYAHNDLLQLIFEFGVGSILLIMVLFNALKSNKSETAILFTICSISLFTYPTHVPVPAFIAFLVAGYLTANTPLNWNIWNNWGPNLFKRDTAKEFIKA